MIGQTVESSPRFPWPAFWGVIAVMCGFVGYQFQIEALAETGCFLLAFAAALHLGRPRPLVLRFEADRLEVLEPQISIPYSSIEAILCPQKVMGDLRIVAEPGGSPKIPADLYFRDPMFPINLIHTQGTLPLPQKMTAPSTDLLRFFYSKLSMSGSREVATQLSNVLHREQELFGDERIWTYRQRRFPSQPPGLDGRTISWLFLLEGVAALILGIINTNPVEICIGILCLPVGIVCLIMCLLRAKDRGTLIVNSRLDLS